MPSSMSDFINTYIGMAQLQNQQQQTENAARSQAVQGMNTFMTVARQTADPALLTGLVDRFSELGVGTKDELLQILQHVVPTEEALKSYSTRQGLLANQGLPTDSTTQASGDVNKEAANTALTGAHAGELAASKFLSTLYGQVPTTGPAADNMAAALGTRTAAQVLPGQLVLDHALSQLPGNEITQGAGIGIGTRMGASADAANQLGWANLREEDRKTAQYGALQEAGFKVDLTKAGMAALKGDQSHIPGLLATKEQLISKLTDSKTAPPASLVTSYIGALNAINQQLTQAGIANEGQIQYSPEMMTNPGWMLALRQRLAGVNKVTFTPQPPATGRRPQAAGVGGRP